MKLTVKLKQGSSPFNRMEGGHLKSYQPGDVFSVGAGVYQAFKDRLEVQGEAPADPATNRSVGGTDDDRDALERERLAKQARDAADLARQQAADLERQTAEANADARRLEDERDSRALESGTDANGSPVPAIAPTDAPEGQEVAPEAGTVAQHPPEDAPTGQDAEYQARVTGAVDLLATVGVNVDREKAKTWKMHDLERVAAVVDRKGVNLPKFILQALAKK